MLWFVQFNLLVVLVSRIKTIRQLTSLKKERLTDSRVQGKKKNILEDPLQRVTDNESHHIIIRGQQSREVTDTKHF